MFNLQYPVFLISHKVVPPIFDFDNTSTVIYVQSTHYYSESNLLWILLKLSIVVVFRLGLSKPQIFGSVTKPGQQLVPVL